MKDQKSHETSPPSSRRKAVAKSITRTRRAVKRGEKQVQSKELFPEEEEEDNIISSEHNIEKDI